MRVYAYMRVSTDEQKTDLQREAIQRYCEQKGWSTVTWFEDKLSGRSTNRPQLQKVLNRISENRGCVLIIWKLDRLCRSLHDFLRVLKQLEDYGCSLVSVSDSIDLTTASGRLMLQIVGAFAEFESNLNKERTLQGLAAARAKGVKLGRKFKIDYVDLEHKVRGMIFAGRDSRMSMDSEDSKSSNQKNESKGDSKPLSIRELARSLNVSKGAIQRVFAIIHARDAAH